MSLHTSRLAAALGAATVLATASTGWAQVTSNNLPTTVQPGNIENQLPGRRPMFGSTSVEVPQQPEVHAPAGSEKIRFKLKSVTVEGSTVYSAEQLSEYAKDFIGKDVSLADIYTIAGRITAKYRNNGYILSRAVVPTQDVTAGNVRLIAVEGFISNVDFMYEKGAKKHTSKGMEKAVAESITSHKPLRAGDLERSLLLLNDRPGLNVRAVVKPSTVARAADVDVILSYKAVDGYVQVDNRGTRYIGPTQGVLGVRLHDIFHDGGTIGLRGALSYDANEMRFAEGSYAHPLGTSGLSGNVLASKTRTRPGYNLNAFDVAGRADHLEAGVTYPLIRGRNENLAISGRFTYDNIATSTLGSELFDDKVRAVRLGADWQKNDRWNGFNAASVEISKGINGLGSSKPNDGLTSRAAAKPDFTKVTASISREQYFADSNFSLAGTIGGQYADKPLYASEEFGLGGATFLSAFDPNEVAGESGAAVRLEPRYTQYVSNRVLDTAQYYAFYDTGVVFNRDNLPGQNDETHLSSLGAGVRLYAKQGFSGSVEVAKPVVGNVAAEKNSDDPRVFFRVTKTF